MRTPRRILLTVTSLVVAWAVLPGFGAVTQSPGDEPELLTSGLEGGAEVVESAFEAASWCRPDTSPGSLSRLFDGDPGGIVGADYPRTLDLGGGVVFWTFQDARFRLSNGSIRTVHNIGVVQTGRCFRMLTGGSAGNPRSWLFDADTTPLRRWFWPLDAELGTDGRIYVFMAEMREEGSHYLDRTVPQATRVAAVNTTTWNVEWYGSATNSSRDLYGWSIMSDDEWTYLFAQCHRQFGFDHIVNGVLGHDKSCSPRVTVARVRRGRLFDAPRYWTGGGWHSDPRRAAPIIGRTSERFSNPSQFLFVNNRWMAVTKINDWWGSKIYVEMADRATGPYGRVATITPALKCADCNTYFASWAEGQTGGGPASPLMVSLSHNRWDGLPSSLYRPTFFTIPPPPNLPAVADRCRIGHCD
jgi:hypothetical protein